VLVATSLAILGILAIGRFTGPVAGIAIGGAFMAIGLLLVRGWLVAVARVNRYLPRRSDLGSGLRATVLVVISAVLVIAVVAGFASVVIGVTVVAGVWRDLMAAG
jgi:hypothetical protein